MAAPWTIEHGDGPVIATAIHDGHDLRPAVAANCALSRDERMREEDPATGTWTAIGDTRVVVHRSRFEVDLNRPRRHAVYRTPDDAWGLDVWRSRMHPAVVEGSLRLHDRFYAQLEDVIGGVVARHGFFLLLDLHSYNHRRGGPRAPVDDPEANPEINVGTATLDRLRFGRVADALVDALRGQEGPLGPLDVRENVRFQGGYLSRWANTRFLGAGCALALDVKKIYMDEWTGKIAPGLARMIGEALAAAIPAALAAFETVDRPVNPAA